MSVFADSATVVTALGSAVAAGAAWRSASASSTASNDARDAVALNIRPYLNAYAALDVDAGKPTGVLFVLVTNESAWPATDLRLEIRYRDGHVDQQTRERLQPTDPTWTVTVQGVQASGPDGYSEFRDRIASVVVIYSDDRNIARYQQLMEPTGAQGSPLMGIGQHSRIR